MSQSYSDYFKTATGHQPYAYQQRLAESDCESRLISIPTGLGKTAAVILAWLWNRAHLQSESWARRLVYCLPMRTLVEQTRNEAEKWLSNLNLVDQIGLHILMGGEDASDWDLYPEKDAILIGTQDMLLSRALNRGYGMARARWPMHFGLLNNDCLWVIDEMQLMGEGLSTTAQLQAFRTAITHTYTWWMSATLQSSWLETPDTQNLLEKFPPNITTSPPTGILKPLTLSSAMDEKGIATLIAEKQSSGTTLVILNTVKRAQDIYNFLKKNKSFTAATDVYLAHSRFRPVERATWGKQFLSSHSQNEKPRVIIATQIVEAGVDISSDTLITELAPWTSLVQRFGRAARYGGTANVIVIDITEEKKSPPYDFAELEAAREELKQLTDVSIETLTTHAQSLTLERCAALYPYSPNFLLLRHEVEELFDTTPDLSGADLDISRYIRSGTDTDCQIAWIAEKPTPNYSPSPFELCSAPIGEAKKFAEARKNAIWRWDFLDGEWKLVRKEDIYPGMVLVALASAGGYSETTGFDPNSKKAVSVVSSQTPLTESPDSRQDSDALSIAPSFLTIKEHGEDVYSELKKIGIDLSPVLEYAALWHDLGKAHLAFQSIIKGNPGTDTAKAPAGHWLRNYKVSDNDPRPGFRHELASALALLMIRHSLPVEFTDEEFDLLIYLIASHHGKVRARLASVPADQEHPVAKTGGEMPIRGIMNGDVVSGASFGLPDATLSLDPAAIGFSPKTGASWTERVLGLLEKIGPFRLAYLETLLRAADCRASKPKQ